MKFFVVLLCLQFLSACSSILNKNEKWILIDNFEQGELSAWHNIDAQNDTNPPIDNPQVTEIYATSANRYLLKKAADDGVLGNRKALSFTALPEPVDVGDTYTFYTRIMVQNFPNNHAFGLSNISAEQISTHGYDAFEPTLRVTDKFESNGFKNDGTLMVKIDSDNKYRQYSNIQDYSLGISAKPLHENSWYQVWYVVNNSLAKQGGQSYDVYLQGGEFIDRTLVYRKAAFRMKREMPLIYFVANSNTGPHDKPYGNGGLAYDDIYMSKGVNLTLPTMK